jgi:hypothetical protein
LQSSWLNSYRALTQVSQFIILIPDIDTHLFALPDIMLFVAAGSTIAMFVSELHTFFAHDFMIKRKNTNPKMYMKS